MPTAAFANLGCKVNQYETDKMIDSFVERGFEIADFDSPADVYVINTCSVTSAADRKSRYMARRAARQKEGAKVILTGCFAQLALDTNEQVEGASLLVPNREKMRVAAHTLDTFPDLMGYTASPANYVEPSPIAVFPEQAGLFRLTRWRDQSVTRIRVRLSKCRTAAFTFARSAQFRTREIRWRRGR